MEISGKIIQILPASEGQSAKGGWKRQDFILETTEQFPKKVCISNWNEKVDLNQHGIGTEIKASINIESREFNNRWYTDVKVWKMEVVGKATASKAEEWNQPDNFPPPPEQLEPDDLPF